MRRLVSEADLRVLSSVLAIVLVLTSLPLTSGIVIASGPAQPEFAVNICLPIQTVDRVPVILLARPATASYWLFLPALGSLAARREARIVERNLAPDTPPPRQFI
jgi:hypothetical protein